MKSTTKKRLWQLAAVLILVLIAAAMWVIGRGHTVYLDNRTLDAAEESFEAYNRINVYVKGERLAKLSAKDRGKAVTIGQNFTVSLEVTKEKGDEPVMYEDLHIRLPHGWDGIVINLPAYLAGAPQEVWMSEFVTQQTEPAPEEEEIVTDEFALGDF